MRDEAGVLTALAQETRLRVGRTLLHALPDGMPAGRLGPLLRPPTLTFHLRQWQEAGLVEPRRWRGSMLCRAVPAGGLTGYRPQRWAGPGPPAQ